VGATANDASGCLGGRGWLNLMPAMRNLLATTAAAALLLAGCSSSVIKASDVNGWPLKSATAEITRDGQQPIKAKLDNGVTYALNGTTSEREGIELLNTDSGQFLPHPDPELRALGVEFANLGEFNTAADKISQYL